jgi:sialate O-acetylesterase
MIKFFFMVLLVFIPNVLAEVKLPAILGNHMVLQCDAKVRLWGWANPKEKITVSFNGQKSETQAVMDGTWSVRLKPMKAGGPFEMTVTGKNTIVLKDILVGEVWVGSGQSNMAMSVAEVNNAEKELASANYPNIRLFTVANASSPKPCDNLNGSWAVCSPETARWFSATAFFFGRQIHKDLNVPVGLINSSVGGTPIEAWLNLSEILKMKELAITRACRKTQEEVKADMPEYEKKQAQWNKNVYTQDPGNKGFGWGWAEPGRSTADWKTMTLPDCLESVEGLDIDGVVWFRRDVEIPAEWAGKDLEIKLGPIDDGDTTYFNNVKVGGIGIETPDAWITPRKYTIPGKWVKAGRNVLAIRVYDQCLAGGFLVGKGGMTLGLASGKSKMIDLGGPWFYKVEFGVIPKPLQPSPVAPYVARGNGAPGGLYNAMIAPLTSFAVRGVIWYQGEANIFDPISYQSLLPGMIRGWRSQWGQGDFPFLVVQLAGMMPANAVPTDSCWARLRESQLLTVQKVPNTALAVAIDIGDTVNIHPKNKQEVGRRLALAAEALANGKKIEYSGPIYKSMKVKGNKIRLKFDHVGGGLVAQGGEKLVGFAIAGADMKFVWAEAKIESNKIIVWSDKVANPAAVRYGWANNPKCNLYNKAGLPASPFRTDQ